MNSKKANSEGRLIPITVRFTTDGYDAICDLAEQYKMSKAEIVRLATDDRLIKYLGNTVYIDKEQGEAVTLAVGKIGTELEKIRLELNRIGVNYNQAQRLKNIQEKYKNRTDFDSIRYRMNEEDEVQSGINAVTEKGIGDLIDRFENLTKEAGDLLCTLA